MKKFICILICVIFTFLSLVACDVPETAVLTPTPTAGTQSGENNKNSFIPESLQGLDFGGEKINFIVSGSIDSQRSIKLPENDDETYAVNLAVARRNRTMKEELNLEIGSVLTLSPEEMTDKMREVFSSPEPSFDIVSAYEYYDFGLTASEGGDKFVDFNTLPQKDMHIDLDAPYWDKDSYNALASDGKNYFVTGDISVERTKNTLVSFVNRTIWDQNSEKIKAATGYSDLYDLVMAGKWTYDTLGKLGGICISQDDSITALFAGTTLTFAKDGEFAPDIEAFGSFSNDVKAMLSAKGIFENIILQKDSSVSPLQKFSAGECLVTFGALKEGQRYISDSDDGALRNMADDYYIVPLPKKSEGTPYHTSVLGKANVFAILSSSEKAGAASVALEVMGYVARNDVNKYIIASCVRLCYCHDTDKMEELALYSVNNVEYITDPAISSEISYETKITDFLKENLLKDDFKALLSEKKDDFKANFNGVKAG